jgi:nucleotidyltransferase/DNA polymerase involved in DNA repair
MRDDRKLNDLAGVGRATIADLHLLGIHSVAQLAAHDGERLYEKLCQVTGKQHDICCLDVFRCAIAQAADPALPIEQTNWWYWSNLRKQQQALINKPTKSVQAKQNNIAEKVKRKTQS